VIIEVDSHSPAAAEILNVPRQRSEPLSFAKERIIALSGQKLRTRQNEEQAETPEQSK
jgi:hypothetical protein